MRLGGLARYVIEIERPEEVREAYNFARQNNLPVFILGAGANSIGRDEGFNGAILINRMRGIYEEKLPSGNVKIKAMGGEPWDAVVEYACSRNLTGIEALSKIPGLAGAAPVQNIGAYGQEIADTLTEIEVFDSTNNTIKTLTKSELDFSYRKSLLNTTEKNRYFVISITLELKEGEMPRPFYNSIENYIAINNLSDYSPKSIREIVSKIRADKLPDPKEKPSAGSFFKNIYLTNEEAEIAEEKGYPVYRGKDGNKINSGWLIEQAGLSGKVLHGIRVNEKASLVLINESAKSYDDLAKARAEIAGKVYDKFGFWLEQEPVEIK
jgi:UDP-N-acetylmuramate dehydrogenase